MKKYRIRDIRERTGLTRKQIYDYSSIKPVGTENDVGYKLYNEEGLRKLSVAAMLSQLGMRPKEINDIFSSDNYDWDTVISELIEKAKEKRAELDDIIHAAEVLSFIGKPEIAENPLRGNKLHEIAEQYREQLQLDDTKRMEKNFDEKKLDRFFQLLSGLKKHGDIEDLSPELDEDIGKILEFAEKDLKLNNPKRFLANIAMSGFVSDKWADTIDSEIGRGSADAISRAMAMYIYGHLLIDINEVITETFIKDIRHGNYESQNTMDRIGEVISIFGRWIGVKKNNEINSFLEVIARESEAEIGNEDYVEFFDCLKDAITYYDTNELGGKNDD